MATTRTRRKRRVGSLLKRLRESSERTMDDVADFLEVKRPTVVRMESGETLPRRRDLTALVTWLGGTDQDRKEALAAWEDAKQDTTRIVLPGSTTPQLRSYLSAEADAAVEKIIAVQVVHGLFQSYDYAVAIMQAPTGFQSPESEATRYVDARLRRQGRLHEPYALSVHAIFDEAVIRRVVGGPALMIDQLKRLLTLAEQPNITLQVVPFAAGVYGTMSGGSAILEFPDPEDPPAAYVEYTGGGRWIEDPDDLRRLSATFDVAVGTALSPTDTGALIQQVIRELE